MQKCPPYINWQRKNCTILYYLQQKTHSLWWKVMNLPAMTSFECEFLKYLYTDIQGCFCAHVLIKNLWAREEFKPMQLGNPHFLSALPLLLALTSNHCWHNAEILTRNYGIDASELRTCTDDWTLPSALGRTSPLRLTCQKWGLALPERLGICCLVKVISFMNQRYEGNLVCSQ